MDLMEAFRSAMSSVAMVHVDCDFYEPTRLFLNIWYPRLSPGGYMQFDDYSAFSGCQRAVDEFLNIHPELKLETLGEQDGVLAFFIKKPR